MAPEASLQESPPSADERLILLVEDDPDIAEIVELLLTNEGYSVRSASDGAQALALLRSDVTPSLIILDLMMPGMDGWEFRAEQLCDPALVNIPVVVMSGAGDAARDASFLRETVWLKKPLELSQLLAVVARLS